MNPEFNTSAMLEEDSSLDAESNELVAPRQRGSKTGLRLGVALVVLGAVGLAGLNHVGAYPFTRKTTPMQHLTWAQDKLMAAFPARALADAANFEATLEGVFKEVGSDDPSAMSMNVTLTPGKGKEEWPKTTFTFLAMEGRETELQEHLKAVKQGFVDVQCEHSDDEDCKKMFDIVTITEGEQSLHFGKGKFVFVEVLMPNGPEGEEADKALVEAFKEHDPKLLAEVKFGRTIEDMYDHVDTNIAVLPKGVLVKVSAAFASTMFSALNAVAQGEVAPGEVKFMTGLTKLSSRNEILYKSENDLADAFSDIPTLADQVSQLKQNFRGMPPQISKPAEDLYKFCEGVAGIEVTGLPGGWEILLSFEHFHPSKVLSSILKPE